MNNNLSKLNLKPADDTRVNQGVSTLTTVFNSTLDKHAPLRLMSRKEKRLSYKPWITRGIITSIKTKNRLFKKLFKNKSAYTNSTLKEQYKKYLNKLTQIKNFAKRNYYEKLIRNNIKDASRIWSIIKEIIDLKNCHKKNCLLQ